MARKTLNLSCIALPEFYYHSLIILYVDYEVGCGGEMREPVARHPRTRLEEMNRSRTLIMCLSLQTTET
jgi:hypothetical protein